MTHAWPRPARPMVALSQPHRAMFSIFQNLRNCRNPVHKLTPFTRHIQAFNQQQRQLTTVTEKKDIDSNEFLSSFFSLSGKVAFVTGCSGGIGRQTCLTLAKWESGRPFLFCLLSQTCSYRTAISQLAESEGATGLLIDYHSYRTH